MKPSNYRAWREEELTKLGHPELAKLPPTDERVERGPFAHISTPVAVCAWVVCALCFVGTIVLYYWTH